MEKAKKNANKEFRLSSWAINNPSVIYVMIAIFLFIGISSYFAMPREEFPEAVETKIYVSTIYPGNTAEDMERLITDPLEDRLKDVSNFVEMTSTSQEDYSMIVVEFDEDITVEDAKQEVKDEVDVEKASEDWPVFNGAKVEPNVFDLNLAESFPILNVNIKGDYPVEKLKEYAEHLEDEIENLDEIKQVDIRGAQDKEVEVAVDINKMMAARINFDNVIQAISNGNMTMSAGNLITSGQRRTIRITGEIEEPSDLNDFVVKSENGTVYLKDIAEVTFAEEDKNTYAREMGQSVVMLDIKKRSGKNDVIAIEKIREIVGEEQNGYLPEDLEITFANDSSSSTLNQVDDLVNNIIFGIILVVTVLMFFLGFRNALFVGFAIPMSMFMSFMILSALGYTLNTMILFGLIMGLGMLVDNGVVVVENVYRLMEQEGMSRKEAAKKGIGEIAVPIIISTATTVAAFVPLGLWPGIMGEFMIYFPITLSVVLGSSLFVAIFMNSMLVSQFMEIGEKELTRKQLIRLTFILVGFGVFIFIVGGSIKGLGTLMVVVAGLFWVYKYFLKKWSIYFQKNCDRHAGLVSGLEAVGESLHCLRDGRYSREDASLAAREMMDLPQPPDAIFVGNDHMAFAVMDTLRFDLGVRIPQDLSIVGYDDVPLASWASYDLTTVRQPSERMVDATVDTLIEQITTPDAPVRKTAIDGPLQIRRSARVPKEWI